jgi:putative CocE/NonD family hydrolase
MREQARNSQIRNQQRLILGPWDHGTVGKSLVGEVDFGPEATVDTFAIQLEWFERFLKQDPSAQAKPFAPVRYFSMGDNRWHEAQNWPPEGFSRNAFYLSSNGKANTRAGTGRITRDKPTQAEPPDQFTADPADPVPANPITEKRPLHAAVWGPLINKAPRIATMSSFTQAPPREPLTFAGNAEARLFVSTDTVDADWAVKLIAVKTRRLTLKNLASGILRGRYRVSLTHPSLMEPRKSL